MKQSIARPIATPPRRMIRALPAARAPEVPDNYPALVPGISDYWINTDTTRLWTTSALSTNVNAAGDPVGGWRGQLDARTLTQATAGTRAQYELDGILLDSRAAFKNLNQTVTLGANDPFFLWARQVCTSTNAADFGLSVSNGTIRSGIAGAFGIDYRARVKFDGTTGNYDTDTDETGDRFIAVWYDGANGYAMNDAGVVGDVAIGTNASGITRLWVNALLASASVSKVKNMGFGTSAVTSVIADHVRQWSKSRP